LTVFGAQFSAKVKVHDIEAAASVWLFDL